MFFSTRTENFALTVNQAFPLFPPGALSDQIKNGTICNALPSIILYLSVETMGVYCWRRDMNVDQALHRFTKSVAVSTETVVDPLALNQWRTACLLSWYCFQQSPSNDEVIRIAVLTRKAYQCGLHQIDSEENRASFGWDLVGQETLEDWRHVWWCIYALDCHASFLTATPHLVESDSIMTALPRTQPQPGCNWNLASPKHFLTSDWGNMWRVIEEISNAGGDKTCSLHTAVSILLKEATTLRRLHNQNPRQSIRDRMSALEDYLSAVQLALPPNYMRQSRDILHGESDVAYHRRLLTSLKIYSSRLLLRLPFPCLLDTAEWDGRWQETLKVCYQMVAIIQQWDIRCMPAVDPSIYFVTLSLLILLHLHSLSIAVPQPALYEQLTRRKDIVRLFLRNYAMNWSLPRYFLESYDVFAYKLTMPLCPQDIMLVMSQFHGPLHRKWLKFLSLSPPMGSCADDYQALAAINVIPVPAAPAAGRPRPADGFGVWTI
ncbi:hypothetical protein GQ53DRAFT_862936 [Thozetella sp. PMI_491]|nr:hypothetical protein GQ53DRAFT_862936 [Thozetella sp. PMI_491]